jgi:hypothetical protein
VKKIIITICFLFINNYVQANDRFMPPDINATHAEMQNRLENGSIKFNSAYIRSYVKGLIHKKLREGRENADFLLDETQKMEGENTGDEDVLLIDDTQQTNGSNIINSVVVESGAIVEGDIFIIDSGDGDITLIDNN